ncbi:serine protease [Longimycelium tulufanense]|uniref:Serine protease n=1 Tax=Longimycelium tulufanense TaxID=907463 RepID=A0A8J3CBC5_9PSEU|nr:S1 family peptidase [Longimycelium tulufanense]GGM43961.1 serine protease [Longimycelium tulufanense]
MKPMNAARIVGAAIVVAGTAAAFTVPAAAAPATAGTASPEMLSAMERDLGLTADQVKERLASEHAANEAEQKLRGSLGGNYGGAYYDAETRKLIVGVTDLAVADSVRAAGAVPKLVDRSESALDTLKAGLDGRAGSAPESVRGWYVDPKSNSVVVNVAPGAVEAAKSFAGTSGVRYVETAEAPQPLYDVRGGDAYYIDNRARCSVGFSVTRGSTPGFVSAGHCGQRGSRTLGYNRASQGTFQASIFPNRDMAWVAVNSNWTPRPLVNRYSGNVQVAGSQEAAVGASICRSGSTTGWHCGRVQGKNETVRYPQGAVYGMTRTSVCAEPGDSGGSFISGSQAQGVTSGGSGNCRSGGTTYFQPVNPILSQYGLRLVTS